MPKKVLFPVRMTPAEKRALLRYARHQPEGTVAALFRARILNAALQFDPKQRTLPLGEKG